MASIRTYLFVIAIFCFFISIASCSNKPLAAIDKGSENQQSIQLKHEGFYDPNPVDSMKLAWENQNKYRGSEARVFDLIHTRLNLEIDWEKEHVIGKAHLKLAPYFYAVNSIELDANFMQINEVALVKKNGDTESLDFEYDNFKIDINLNKPFAKGEEFELFVDYVSQPQLAVDSCSEFTYDNQGLYFINPKKKQKHIPQQLWTQGETESNSIWFPTLEQSNVRCTQEVFITVEKDLKTLSNGLLVSSQDNVNGTRTDHWKQDIPHAPYLFMLAVGPYSVTTEMWRDIELSYYVDLEYAESAKAIFGKTPAMMDFFSELLDFPFPWEKYAQIVVRDFVAGAMENTTAVTYNEDVQKHSRELLDDDDEDIVAHELMHHWFGNLVTCESWSNLALNEAFATYGEYLWIEKDKGRDAADQHLHRDLRGYLNEANSKQVPIVRFKYKQADDMFDRHSYNKGGRVLHLLRSYIGDDAFFESVRLYLKQNAYKAAEIHDLRLAFEQVTGQDLNWFFNQWFLEAGHPFLMIEKSYDSANKQVELRLSQKQEDTQIFRLPLAIDLYYEDGTSSQHDIVFEENETTFYLPSEAEPVLVNVDSDKSFLGEKSEEKSLEEFAWQYRLAPRFLDRYEAQKGLQHEQQDSLTHQVCIEMLDDPLWDIRSKAVQTIDIKQKNSSGSIKNKLLDLSYNDPKPQVRANAMGRLVEWKEVELADHFEKRIADSSYLVMATALTCLFDIDKDRGIENARKTQHIKNKTITNIVARILASKGDEIDQGFFEDRLRTSHLFERYSLIDYYSNYLKESGDTTNLNSIPLLEDISRTDDHWWVRLVSTQTIIEVKDRFEQKLKILEKTIEEDNETETLPNQKEWKTAVSNLNRTINDIKASEKDTKLLEYYENM